ncbi:MAG: phospholipase D family protein [Planctomycetota bacterium]
MRRIQALVVALALLPACSTPNFDHPREPSFALDPSVDTQTKRGVDAWRAKNPGPCGFYPLTDGTDALAVRLRLIEAAERTIDAQYFLMKSDSAGYVFAGALHAAAERGVRVRLLLDDIFTTFGDHEMALLDAHPNVEIRLFNPISRRGVGVLNFVHDFRRANRRMHNKSFIVDNQAAVVGGRNIADEYFDLRPEGEFLDFDVLAIGSIASEVSGQFDVFWNHHRSLPLEAVYGKTSEAQLERLRAWVGTDKIDAAKRAYDAAIRSSLMRSFDDASHPLYSATATLMTDRPDKLVNDIAAEHMVLVGELTEVLEESTSEIIVISPYFVPGDVGVAFWRRLVEEGRRVIVLTNSLAANNHTAVHSAYRRYRKDLVRAGVELYEIRAYVEGSGGERKALTLHTKSMIIDSNKLFVGSLNLDPRSIEINSEMGLVIGSEELVARLREPLLVGLQEFAYRVTLDEKGRTRWSARIGDEDVVETSEPQASNWLLFSAWFQAIAPERML